MCGMEKNEQEDYCVDSKKGGTHEEVKCLGRNLFDGTVGVFLLHLVKKKMATVNIYSGTKEKL